LHFQIIRSNKIGANLLLGSQNKFAFEQIRKLKFSFDECEFWPEENGEGRCTNRNR